MGRHRKDPEEEPPASLEDKLWAEYKAIKQASGSDSTETFEAFFDWWEVT